MTTNTPLRGPFYGTEKRWARISIPDALDDGAQIQSVAWTAESPLTMIGGSGVIYTRTKTNDSAKARFNINGASPGRYRITAVCTTTDGEDVTEHIIWQVKLPPE